MNLSVLNPLIPYFRDLPVLKAYVFGSYARGEETDDSDIDILLEMPSNLDPVDEGLIKLQIYEDVERILHKKVDVIDQKYLSNPFLIESINEDKILLYEKE